MSVIGASRIASSAMLPPPPALGTQIDERDQEARAVPGCDAPAFACREQRRFPLERLGVAVATEIERDRPRDGELGRAFLRVTTFRI
jgi:hypothetical protein